MRRQIQSEEGKVLCELTSAFHSHFLFLEECSALGGKSVSIFKSLYRLTPLIPSTEHHPAALRSVNLSRCSSLQHCSSPTCSDTVTSFSTVMQACNTLNLSSFFFLMELKQSQCDAPALSRCFTQALPRSALCTAHGDTMGTWAPGVSCACFPASNDSNYHFL